MSTLPYFVIAFIFIFVIIVLVAYRIFHYLRKSNTTVDINLSELTNNNGSYVIRTDQIPYDQRIRLVQQLRLLQAENSLNRKVFITKDDFDSIEGLKFTVNSDTALINESVNSYYKYDENDNVCAICIEVFKDDDLLKKLPGCGHR
ncbi:hypothetical protein HK096_003879 [Nowakowskiella sp. JEL0078]|nr:hypothetical protein HK096_003879 [Nowakowskiella sp. JEL0078]